jgi:hypothetical protein
MPLARFARERPAIVSALSWAGWLLNLEVEEAPAPQVKIKKKPPTHAGRLFTF